MVVLHVKRGDESQFLYETEVEKSVDEVVEDITAIFNGRLKVERICYEMEELQKHGTFLPLEMQGLTDEQIKELKLEDPWEKRCAPQGAVFEKDEMGRRCGLAPPPHLQEVLKKAAETAKEFVSKKHASKEVIDPSRACLWACGKKFLAGNQLSDHLGKCFLKIDRRHECSTLE
ncbi:Uncharacterized protein OBRU01_03338 [Operophtera brumata]|uniref:Uncharacterized protein n=1 Tax=Operophtera brumata TaxID=104452 RepID=A0A0L7LQU4_OPEBR|nr:Uncharacterized protein OBRU01_03338 [Operophtera brumata]